MGTKIQQAAAKIKISACRTGVSDIHVEPRQDNYKVRVRRDGVMQLCDHAPFRRNQAHRLLQKHGQNGYCRTACIPRRQNPSTLEGQIMEFAVPAPGKYGEKMVMRFLNSDAEMLSLDTDQQ